MIQNSYSTRTSRNHSIIKKIDGSLLQNLDVELTERCNNNCIHCCINLPSQDKKARSNELTTDSWKQILKEAALLGCLYVRFTGGEPLLREDFEELYIYTRKLGIKVLVFTNATLIKPDVAELFAKIPPLEKIEVSLYGNTKRSYEAITRVPGSFRAAMRGIHWLQKKNIPFVIKSAYLPPNRDEVEELKKWEKKLSWMEIPMTFPMHFNLRIRRDSIERNRMIKSLRVPAEEAIKLRSKSRDYLFEAKMYISQFIRPPSDRLFGCGAGNKSVCVDAYGFLQPCLLIKHPDMSYDLKKGSLKQGHQEFLQKIRAKRAKNTEYLNRCARCFLQGLCEQCPGRSWTENGTLDSPVDYFCLLAHEEARGLGLLKPNENAWEVEDSEERIESFLAKKEGEI